MERIKYISLNIWYYKRKCLSDVIYILFWMHFYKMTFDKETVLNRYDIFFFIFFIFINCKLFKIYSDKCKDIFKSLKQLINTSQNRHMGIYKWLFKYYAIVLKFFSFDLNYNTVIIWIDTPQSSIISEYNLLASLNTEPHLFLKIKCESDIINNFLIIF